MTAHAQQRLPVGCSSARTASSTVSVASRMSSAYERASCEYQTRNGLTASSPAATRAAGRDTNLRAVHQATGIVAVPISAESDRSPTSLVPKILAQTQATQE